LFSNPEKKPFVAKMNMFQRGRIAFFQQFVQLKISQLSGESICSFYPIRQFLMVRMHVGDSDMVWHGDEIFSKLAITTRIPNHGRMYVTKREM
jgi:hypothetical protein